MNTKHAAVAAACLSLMGCVNTSNVLQTGANTYTVSSTADGMRPASHAREEALTAANEKCRALGKTIEVVSDSSERTRMGIDTTVTVNFKCL